ncbi:MAG: penicillin-binding protein activator [Desulfovibrionaceae bacterium]
MIKHPTMTIRLATVSLLLCLSLLSACQGGLPFGRGATKDAATLPTAQLMQEADAAFDQGRFAQSEFYYQNLADRPDLARADQGRVLERLADSALHAGHPMQAQLALERWAMHDPQARSGWAYTALTLDTYRALGREGELASLKGRLLSDVSLAWEIRYRAAVRLAMGYAEEGRSVEALGTLSEFYATAPDATGRVEMERALAARLVRFEDVEDLVTAVPPAGQMAFPGALVVFEAARRDAAAGKDWASAWKIMRGVLANASLQDKVGLGDALHALERAQGQPRVGVALLLPMTGRYQEVGRKIARGAGVAQWQMANNGVELDVKVINTDAPDWLGRLAALPSQYAVVGGPLRVSSFKELAASDEMRRRAVFAFLPSLGEMTEGRDAWRFFSSRDDEVRALVGLASRHLGISRFGLLYPDESFGHEMAAAFRQEALRAGGTIAEQQSYAPKDSPSWGRKIRALLKVPDHFDKEAPLPPAPFQAVFLPDGWSQAQLLVPNFFFYDSTDMVFLGPSLWSSALDRVTEVEEAYFRLAVTPGAWWAGTPGAQQLQSLLDAEGLGVADLWVALGYDWLRMTGNLGAMPADWNPALINRRLSSAARVEYSLAPMSWDGEGRASQEMFLFKPAPEGGMVLVEPADFAERLQRAHAKRAERVKLWRQNNKSR